mgnify:CR=1 FL=1
MKLTLAFLLLTTSITNAEPFRIFTDNSGRTISARILEHDSALGKIQLERKGGKKAWAAPEIFSNEDQAFIQIWVDRDRFLNASLFTITIEENKTRWEPIDGDQGIRNDRRQKKTSYTVSLSNTNDTELDNLRLEYCVFRDRNLNRRKFIESDFETKDVGSISSGSTKEIQTGTSLSFKASGGFLNDVVGVLIRIHMITPDGSELMRELRYPHDLAKDKYVWSTKPRKQ